MQPLSNEEICERFKKLSDIKDAQRLRCARRKTYAEVLQASSFLVRRMTMKYRGLDDYDDLYQVGLLILYQAIRTFNYRESPNFYAWCYRWIKKEIAIAAFRQKRYHQRFEVTDTRILRIEELADSNPEEYVFSIERQECLEKACKVLGKRPGYIIRKLFGVGGQRSSLREIGNNIGLSHEHVRRIKDSALQQLSRDPELVSAFG